MYPHDDNSSADEFENIGSPKPKPSSKPLLTEDGKVPDTVYSIRYFTADGDDLRTIQSLEPYEEIPDFDDDDHTPASSGGNDGMPPIQLITKVTVGRSETDSRIGRNRPSRPYLPDRCEPRVPRYVKTIIVINSPHLINAISAVVDYYPQFQTTLTSTTTTYDHTSKARSGSLSIEAPYCVLVHHRDALAAYRDSQPAWHSESYAATTARHIDILLHMVDRLVGEDLRLEDERLRRRVPMATWENLWYVMKPGEVVFTKNNGNMWQPFVVSRVDPGNGQFPTIVYCWQLSFTGWTVDRHMFEFDVPYWLGEQAVQSLSVVPAKYFPDHLESQGGLPILERHVQLGKMYFELMKKATYMEYDGMLVNDVNGANGANISEYQGPTGFMRGRVVCDIVGFKRYSNNASRQNPRHPFSPATFIPLPPVTARDYLPHLKPRCGCSVCHARSGEPEPGRFFGFDNQQNATTTVANSDLYFIVFIKVIPAFLLGERRWGHLNLADIKPLKCDKEAFRYLVLEEEVKHTVKALVGNFAASGGSNGAVSPWGNDFVKNKGEGRIFLLHGSPGVGKTCTAECVAELTNRPLISLTSGDLGSDPISVESSLSYFLELGQRYGALVLLDEADVYLERRRSSDVSRNGLVSVFLRALEYYRGVLFLTTNRVRVFDSAFISRVHVALHYRDLSDQDREHIWANNFERLDRESCGSVHVCVSAREYAYGSSDVKALVWNGREIRNAMQTALAMAESDAANSAADKVTIMDKHIRAVVRMSRGFRDFLALDNEQGQ